ncbi:MAG: lysophospholipid acyltransferase family protein, partial [Ardenticatenaceae bacterium]
SMARALPRFHYVLNRLLRHLILPIHRVRATVAGVEHVPPHGALIIVANHTSVLDVPLLAVHVPRDITFMSKAENFEGHPFKTWVVRNYGAFPVRRGEGDINAIRQALQVLKEGGALMMAPEGTRSPDHRMREPQEGVALVAYRSGAPLLPVGISGGDRFPSHIRRWQPTDVHVSIGRPFHLVSPARKAERAALTAMSEAVMERIAAELPPTYRGRFLELTDNQRFVRDA